MASWVKAAAAEQQDNGGGGWQCWDVGRRRRTQWTTNVCSPAVF
jgi:hypothetical protein